jgi:hypothetical protein
VEDLARLIIHNRGRKAVRDEDLAPCFGFTVEQMYRRLGRKLLLFARSSWFEVLPEKGSATHLRPAVAFTLSGVILVCASLGSERALMAGMAIIPLLKTRRRSSKNRKRRPPRKDDPRRQAIYANVFAQLQKRMQRVLSAGTCPAP